MEKTMELSTKNIKFVAFLRMKNIFHDGLDKIAKGRAKYIYQKVDVNTWNKLKLEFDRSDFLKYAQHLDAVVDLAY